MVSVKYGLILLLVLHAFVFAKAQDSIDFKLKVEACKVINNSKENSSLTPYREYATRTIATLSGYKKVGFKTDKFGGRANVTEQTTGFFYPKKIKGRWWIIDPEGHYFIHQAVNAVSMGSSGRNKEALKQTFGTEGNWMLKTQQLLTRNGFDGVGAWSNTSLLRESAMQNSKPLAYTINLDFMSAYGDKRGGTYQVPGHKGYPNNVIFVFDAAFESFCDEYAQKIAAYQSDHNLLGYFSDNEMPLGLKNLDGYLTLKNHDDPGYVAAKKWIEEKGITQAGITDAHRAEFLEVVADRYFSIVSKAIKKYDANHLYLGCRYHGAQANIEALWRAIGKYADIVSINYYNAWTPRENEMNNWANWSGKPFLVTEWYVKGEDSGLGNRAGAGWIVKTQQDRGIFYQNFTLGLLQNRNCVGWHWFKYLDNDPTQAGAEPSNTDANKGIVDNYYKPYKPLTDQMKELNTQVFSLIEYFDRQNH